MKTSGLVFIALLLSLAISPQSVAQNQGSAQGRPAGGRVAYNPAPFQNNLAPLSAPLRFLLSERGKQLVAASNHPNLRGLFHSWGIELPSAANVGFRAPEAQAISGGTSLSAGSTSCSAGTGALFNLEGPTGSPEIGFPVSQNQESVDYIPGGGQGGSDLVIEAGNDYRGLVDTFLSPTGVNARPFPNAWGFSLTGYYVHRSGDDCGATFEGGLPHLLYTPTAEVLYGGGDAVVAADSTRGQVYAVDLRFGATVTGVGLFKTTVNLLNDLHNCPDGTHLTNSSGIDFEASHCWPTKALVNPVLTIFPSTFSDKPHLRADERASGTGAGDVYISWTNFDLFLGQSTILIAVCPATFTSEADCSSPITISGKDTQTQFSHIAIRQDNGTITLTYVNVNFIDTSTPPFFSETFDLKFVSCVPQGAPNPPVCSAPSLITTEQQPLPLPPISLAANSFTVPTYPTHDVRLNGQTYEDFVVWSRCASEPFFALGDVPFALCPSAKLAMTWSAIDTLGQPQGWAPVTQVGAKPHDQFSPRVRTDVSRNIVNIAYLSTENDHFGHRLQVLRSFIDSGSYTVSGEVSLITPAPNDPSADFLFEGGLIGDYFEIIPRAGGTGSRAYFGFPGNSFQGIVQGSLIGDQNNLLGRLDY